MCKWPYGHVTLQVPLEWGLGGLTVRRLRLHQQRRKILAARDRPRKANIIVGILRRPVTQTFFTSNQKVVVRTVFASDVLAFQEVCLDHEVETVRIHPPKIVVRARMAL